MLNLIINKASCAGAANSVKDQDYSCELGSAKYYGLCGIGGIMSCGLTHTLVVPLDVVKCRVQTNPEKYTGLISGMRLTIKEEKLRSIYKGWAPTLIGYSLQGLGKFGLYEVFKNLYGSALGEENSYNYRVGLYIAASASAEIFADVLLCPMEAVKVRIQTQPGWANTLRQGLPKLYAEESFKGFYKGLVPLWCRQVPYTIMKFASFERVIEYLYQKVLKTNRDACDKKTQLGVTLLAGYIAGVFCAVVSHPADAVVSKLNKQKGSSACEVLKSLGFRGIWGGLLTRIIMVGTLTSLQWFIYDGFKVYFKLPRPPPPQKPDMSKLLREVLEAK